MISLAHTINNKSKPNIGRRGHVVFKKRRERNKKSSTSSSSSPSPWNNLGGVAWLSRQPDNYRNGVMFGEDFFKSLDEEESEKEDENRPQSPPHTRVEWLQSQGLSTWPEANNFSNAFDRDGLLGSMDDIKDDLMSHAPWKGGLLAEIDSKLDSLENKLKELSERFLYAENIRTAVSDETGGIRIVKEPIDPFTFCNPDLLNAMKSGTSDDPSSANNKTTAPSPTISTKSITKTSETSPGASTMDPTDDITVPSIDSSISTTPTLPVQTDDTAAIVTTHRDATTIATDLVNNTTDLVSPPTDLVSPPNDTKPVPVHHEEGSRHIFDDYDDNHIPPLPKKLEALPILDAVTKVQGFPIKFIKPWKKFFCSESSSLMLQCAFWWLWMESNKPDPEAQAHLYTLMAEQFAQLFLLYSTSEIKDKLFQHYPSCLSQGVFAIFCQAYPKSVKTFYEDSFLHKISNYIYEWTTGIPCPLDCWKKWSMEALDPTYKLHTITRKPKRKPITHFSGIQSNVKKREQPIEDETDEEAPMIGPGPTFECVQFITTSQSPLFQHHLYMKRLKENEANPYTVLVMGRTQIKQKPPPSMTFKDLLKNSKELSEKRNEAYEKQLSVYQQQISEAVQENRIARKSIQSETKKLLKKRHEVTIEAEKIMSKYTPQPQVSSYLADTIHDD